MTYDSLFWAGRADKKAAHYFHALLRLWFKLISYSKANFNDGLIQLKLKILEGPLNSQNRQYLKTQP